MLLLPKKREYYPHKSPVNCRYRFDTENKNNVYNINTQTKETALLSGIKNVKATEYVQLQGVGIMRSLEFLA